jgi:hypothetical protein
LAVRAVGAFAPLKPTTGTPLSFSRATVSPPHPPPTVDDHRTAVAAMLHHETGNCIAVPGLDARFAHQRSWPGDRCQ